MFIVSLEYKSSLAEVDKFLSEHIEYLKIQYEKGNFIASGRKIPRTGGIILSQMDTKEALQNVLDQDPFKINDLATYEIQEFIPSMTSDKFRNLKEE